VRQAGMVVFAFGTPKDISSNMAIEDLALRKAEQFCTPIYCDLPLQGALDVTCVDEGLGAPTLRTARGAVRWAVARGLKVLFVIAAPPHLHRSLRDLGRSIREVNADIRVIPIKDFWDKKQYTRCIWYSKKSTQRRTTSPWWWWMRECVLRVLPFPLYDLVAS
jgi:hypothetical protein